jgi:hypothetical protein
LSPDELYNMPGSRKPDDNTAPTPEEQELMDRVARLVVRRGLTVPAIMFFETVKPLNWLGSQGMIVAEPFVWAINPLLHAMFGLKHEDYLKFQRAMEKRHNMENLILTIERFDAEHKIKEDEIRRQLKTKKKELRATRKAKRQKFFRKLFGREQAGDLDRSHDRKS